MSIRTKILLFVGVALCLVGSWGAMLHQSTSRARVLCARLASLDAQLGIYDGMRQQAWHYLRQLLQASRMGQDTRQLLREQEQLLRDDLSSFQAALHAKQSWESFEPSPRESQLVETLIESQRQWAQGVEVVLRPSMAPAPGPHQWGELFSTYEQDVAPHLEKARAAEHAEQRQLQFSLDETLLRTQQASTRASLAICGILVVLGAALFAPLLRDLRHLRQSTEQLSLGDYSAQLPTWRKDELSLLSQAVNHLAEELRTTVREKARLLQGEVQPPAREYHSDEELAARDLLRYNSALEQMVRTRTSELEGANTQLAASLRQLQTMQAQLMFTDRLASMGRLAAGVGHEINNPLAFVISNLSYIHKELHRAPGTASEEERQELLTAVSEAKEGAERVRVIVQDLKTLARPDDVGTGKADLKEVLRAAVKIASHEIRRRARLVEELNEVPAVLGNASRLGQVFLNLIINAAQAIPEGHVEQNEVRITVRQPSAARVVVEIRDTGCGIPPENLDRIFDPFFTTKAVGEGTGLGLSLVHSLLTALGGTITVESQVDKGTVFRVSLPATQAPN